MFPPNLVRDIELSKVQIISFQVILSVPYIVRCLPYFYQKELRVTEWNEQAALEKHKAEMEASKKSAVAPPPTSMFFEGIVGDGIQISVINGDEVGGEEDETQRQEDLVDEPMEENYGDDEDGEKEEDKNEDAANGNDEDDGDDEDGDEDDTLGDLWSK